MTCIVGLKHKDKIYMGCDSLAMLDNVKNYLDEDNGKIFKKGDLLIGLAGKAKYINFLKYQLAIPARPEDMSDDLEYLVTLYIPAMKQLMKENGLLEDYKFLQGNSIILIGYKSNLYKLAPCFTLLPLNKEEKDGYIACGSGEKVALGSLYTSKDFFQEDPKRRIEMALKASSEHVSGVGGPFNILDI